MSTPSSQGMSALTRISWPRSACTATEAILSTTTWRISLASGAGVEHPGQSHDLRETVSIGRRPFARRLAVLAAAHGHQRVRRGHAEHEQAARSELHADLAGHASLRRRQQCLDVAACGVELLALVNQLAVDLAHGLLHDGLAAEQRQLLELAMGGDQDLGGGRLERDAPLGADDRVAQVNAAADAVARAELLDFLEERHGIETLAVERDGNTLREFDLELAERLRLVERAGREHPRRFRNAALRVERLRAADRDTPQ